MVLSLTFKSRCKNMPYWDFCPIYQKSIWVDTVLCWLNGSSIFFIDTGVGYLWVTVCFVRLTRGVSPLKSSTTIMKCLLSKILIRRLQFIFWLSLKNIFPLFWKSKKLTMKWLDLSTLWQTNSQKKVDWIKQDSGSSLIAELKRGSQFFTYTIIFWVDEF